MSGNRLSAANSRGRRDDPRATIRSFLVGKANAARLHRLIRGSWHLRIGRGITALGAGWFPLVSLLVFPNLGAVACGTPSDFEDVTF